MAAAKTHAEAERTSIAELQKRQTLDKIMALLCQERTLREDF
jgi:hypothetical protein